MRHDQPVPFEKVLADEVEALRPTSEEPSAGDFEQTYRRIHASSDPLCALAISGGGYIGSWLTAWLHRVGDAGEVVSRIRDGGAPGRSGPDPIHHLREYSSYLSPRMGALSADVWTLVATVFRNVLLNWLVFLPILMCGALLPRLYLACLAFPELRWGRFMVEGRALDYGVAELDVISNSPWVAVVLPAMSATLFGVALLNILRSLPGLGGRDLSRAQFVLDILTPLCGAVLTFLAFDSLFYLGRNYIVYSNIGSVVLWTSVPAVAALVLFFLTHKRPLLARIRLLFGPLPLAIIFMAMGTGVATWWITNMLLWSADPAAALSWPAYVTVGPPAMILGFVFGTVLFTGLSSTFLEDLDREWMSRAVAHCLIAAVAWTVGCTLVLLVPAWVIAAPGSFHGALAFLAAVSGWLSVLGGAARGSEQRESRRKMGAGLRRVTAIAAPAVFVGLMIAGLSILTNLLLTTIHRLPGMPGFAIRDVGGALIWWTDQLGVLTRSGLSVLGIVAISLLVLGSILGRYVNVNTFSLHGMYRDRLIRAYLGASNSERVVGRFTGFAVNDDVPLSQIDPRQRPFHVVNMTLNVVTGNRLAWQQRKARPFTASPLHCGSRGLGYRSSAEYGGRDGMSLGTAMAISGAAASPSMGYHTSSMVSFIMTLFNARLGVWLGNPGTGGQPTWRHGGPRSAVLSLLREAFGLTSDRAPYVYLSDGGHFDNLGLYEMVARRCRLIVVVDDGCDPDFSYEDLGNALRKIRIDLGVPIIFESRHYDPLRLRERRCAIGQIRYSEADGPCEDGRLLYLKPMMLGNEPPDVASYAAKHPEFPHETTADQWFDESQTESYRMLGRFTVDEICQGWEPGPLSQLIRHVETTYLRTEESAKPRSSRASDDSGNATE